MSTLPLPAGLFPIGASTPRRQIIGAVIAGVAPIVVFSIYGVLINRTESIPLLLMFLLIPAIGIPVWIKMNSWAVVNDVNHTISVNGGEFRNMQELKYLDTSVFRGVCTLTIGYSKERSDRFFAHANGIGNTKKSERQNMRLVIPYSGLTPEEKDTAIRFINDHF